MVDVVIPHLQWMSLAHGLKISSEFAVDFDRMFLSDGHLMEPSTRVTVALGRTMTALESLSGDRLRAWAFDCMRTEVFAKHNLTAVVMPAAGVVPPILHEAAKSDGESNTVLMVKVMKYVFLANFVGMPSYSVPAGFVHSVTEAGEAVQLPVGVQLLGNHWQEHKLLRLAHAIERDRGDSIASDPLPKYFHDALEF